jgi:hypothetical protein
MLGLIKLCLIQSSMEVQQKFLEIPNILKTQQNIHNLLVTRQLNSTRRKTPERNTSSRIVGEQFLCCGLFVKGIPRLFIVIADLHKENFNCSRFTKKRTKMQLPLSVISRFDRVGTRNSSCLFSLLFDRFLRVRRRLRHFLFIDCSGARKGNR